MPSLGFNYMTAAAARPLKVGRPSRNRKANRAVKAARRRNR